MMFAPCLKELRDGWFPHTTDAGLDRLITLLESGSPLLIHGAFTRAMPMGCLATHIAWNHPETAEFSLDAGVAWLTRVAGLNPATSQTSGPGIAADSTTGTCGRPFSPLAAKNATAGSNPDRAGRGRGGRLDLVAA